MSFEVVTEFENKIAEYFGSKYAIAVDSCTHGIELCLRYTKAQSICCPKRTYLSIPFLASKLNIELKWKDENWVDYYYVTDNVIDAAVLWKACSYIPNTFMAISFQFQKHLALGRGGIILTDDNTAATILKKMSYDGRLRDTPWRSQDIDSIGYHYYMTPEIAACGMNKLENAINSTPRKWNINDWPDLTKLKIFKQ